MAQEIERKFLVIGEYKSLAFAKSRIVQGYISSARGRTVRIRIRDDKGYLTIKGASNASGTSRYEWEKELSLPEAEELMKLCEPGIIDKTRYLVRSGRHIFEVDEFYGENEGLVVAEVELVSEDEYLNAKNNFENSKGELKIAEANYIKAKDNFDRLKVIAKIDGIVTDLDLKGFEKTSPNQKLLTVIDNSIMELTIAVSGKDLENSKIGDKADIFVEEIGKNLTGTISEINLSSNSNTKKYSVKLTVENSENNLLKGLYAKVKLQHGTIKGLFVPSQSIMIKDLYSYIVVTRDNVATIYKITPKLTIGDKQLIEFPDYKTGDKLVVEGQYLLNNNDKVREN